MRLPFPSLRTVCARCVRGDNRETSTGEQSMLATIRSRSSTHCSSSRSILSFAILSRLKGCIIIIPASVQIYFKKRTNRRRILTHLCWTYFENCRPLSIERIGVAWLLPLDEASETLPNCKVDLVIISNIFLRKYNFRKKLKMHTWKWTDLLGECAEEGNWHDVDSRIIVVE